MDYMRFLNHYGQRIGPPIIRKLVAGAGGADVSKGATAGFPNPSIFPFEDATFHLKDGTHIEITEEEMNVALQYGKTSGYDELVDLLYKMQCEEHHPPTAGHETGPSKMRLLMSPGAQMALMTFALMCASEDAPAPVLFNMPSFALVSAPLISLVHKALSVEVDADGTSPSSLRKVLSRWTPQDAKNPKSGIPRILWLNPTCMNPAGVTTSAERRKEIYAIAQEYDLLIVEDDPYYYLQENQPRISSYLSLDVDGRVLRFDTFAKIVSPGLRCGFITGPDAIVERMEYAYMQSCQHTSGLSQMVIYKLLKHWGPAGFEDQVQKVIKFNREKRLVALALADKWLKGLAEWNIPPGGMYIFLRVYGTGLTSYELNNELMKVHKVAVVPANGFYPEDDAQLKDVVVLRISIAMVDGEEMEKVMKGLAEVIQDAQTKHLHEKT